MATQTTTIVVKADTSQAERALGNLQSSLKGLVSIAALGALAKSFAQVADASTNLENKLRLVTQEGQNSSQLFNVVAKSAIALGAPLKDVGDLFFRIANNTKDLGLAQTDQLRITETLIKGFQLTGASAGEVSGAVVQLGQAFAVGVLRGDELNSVLEALPTVADALAAKFNVQRGALKALGEQGRITSKDLSDAILASGASIDQAWGNRIPTISESFNRLQTSLTVAVGQLDKSAGISEGFSLALIKIATALVKVIKFFEEWGGVIGFVLEAIILVYAPLRIARGLFAALIGPVEWLIGLFRSGGGVIAGFGNILTRLGEYISPIVEPVTKLGERIAVFFGLLGAGASALGISSLLSGFKGLFNKDQKARVDEFTKAQQDLNKALGIDGVEASNKAKAASAGATAQQLKDSDAIRKANITRNESLKDITRNLQGEQVLTKFIGDELAVQTAIYNANKNLVKEIKNDKGEVIGYTAALTKEEERSLAVLVRQNEELKRQQTIRQNVARATTPLQGSPAAVEVSAQLPNLAPVQAAMTANETLFNGLEYLRQNDLISEQAYQAAKVNAAVQAQAAIMEATSKQYEAQALLRIQAQTGNQFGYETQKAMAKEAADFEKKSTLEKTQFGIEQGAMLFNALGAQNKKAFELAKAFNIANAIMNTYMAATKALATYPPPINFAMAAVAVGMGLAQVAQIRAQTYSGRALGGPVMGNNPYIVGENGPELFTPATSGNITRNDQLGGGGPVNINFNIQAADAAGFDQLLLERKGMIQQMISDSMLERGQRSRI